MDIEEKKKVLTSRHIEIIQGIYKGTVMSARKAVIVNHPHGFYKSNTRWG